MTARLVSSAGEGLIKKTYTCGLKLSLKPVLFTDLMGEGLTALEKVAVSQTLIENSIFRCASKEERSLLAPILKFDYDENNFPFVIMPYFEPLLTEEQQYHYNGHQTYNLLKNKMWAKGWTAQQISTFLTEIHLLCESFGILEEDIVYNLSNIGWNEKYGFRIIDYGMTEELMNFVFAD